MSDRAADRAAGGVWLLGFAGAAVPDGFLRTLERFRPPAVIVFRDNLPDGAASLAPLRARLEEAADGPLAIFLDEEGGWIQQLPEIPWPSPAAQSAAGPGAVARWHRAMGNRLAALGVAATCAPLADLDDGVANPVIGSRAFCADPRRCSEDVAAAVGGLLAAGLRPVLKHFPGHGDSLEDSHLTLPAVPADHGDALAPFRAGIEAGAPAVMTAHLRLEGDADPRPATYRRDLMTDRLSGELGFAGLVITDALEMAGAEGLPAGERGGAALAAGCHLLTLARWSEGAEAMPAGLAADLSARRVPAAALEGALERLRAFLAPLEAAAADAGAVSAGRVASAASLGPGLAAGSLAAPGSAAEALDAEALRRGAVFVPGGGDRPPPVSGPIELEIGHLGSWTAADYTAALAGLDVRPLAPGAAPAGGAWLWLSRTAPPPGRLAQLEAMAARDAAPLLLIAGPWGWSLPFPRRLATAEPSPPGIRALVAAARAGAEGRPGSD